MTRGDKADLRKRVEERGRSGSCGNIEEMLKRKIDDSGKRKGVEEEIFNRSKKTVRSPGVKKEMGEGIEEIIKRLMREELREVVKEIKEVKGWKKEVKAMRKEIKKKIKGGIKEQGERLKKELEEMKKKFRERE